MTTRALWLAAFFLYASCTTKTIEKNSLKETAVHYLVHQSLAKDDFCKQVWQEPLTFIAKDVQNNDLYFSHPRYGVDQQKIFSKLTDRPEKIKISPCTSGDCEFGGLTGNVDSIVPFKINERYLKVDSSSVIVTKLKNYTYRVPLSYLTAVQDSSKYFSGDDLIDLQLVISQKKVCANFGKLVSKKGDSLLTDWAKQITKDCATNEIKAQALLNFVINEIDYSFADYYYQTEVKRKAHEVLMTGLADCSGKTVLYASLLEQLDIPYCLLYYKRHLNVGLVGNFSKENKLSTKVKQLEYFIAETTCKDFVIGKSIVQDAEQIAEPLIYQIPRNGNLPLKVKNNQPVATLNLDQIEF